MDESIRENIIKVVAVIIIIILLMFTISANVKYDKLENEVDGYKYEIKELEETKKEYETLIESYKKSQLEDKAKIAEQTETITNLENQISEKNTKINKLNVEIVTLTKERDQANNKVNTLNEQITVLNTTITTNKKAIEELNTKLTNANNKVNELTTTNESLNSNITTLNNNITNLETRLNSVNKYHVVNSEIELLEAFKNDGNIILNTDIIMSNTVVIKDKYLSVDLNGHNLVVTSIALDNTSLEIKDSKSLGKISLVGDNDDLLQGIKVNNASTLKLTNSKYEGKNLIQVEGTLHVLNPTFITTQEETITTKETAVINLYNVPVIDE